MLAQPKYSSTPEKVFPLLHMKGEAILMSSKMWLDDTHTMYNYSTLTSFNEFLRPAVTQLNYWGSDFSENCISGTEKRGHSRKLKPIDEFFLVLYWLRCNVLVIDLAYIPALFPESSQHGLTSSTIHLKAATNLGFSWTEKRGHSRKLKPIDEFFLVLYWLRCNVLVIDLAYIPAPSPESSQHGLTSSTIHLKAATNLGFS